jgi:hypothetical protein
MEFYIKVGKPFASSYHYHCFAWFFNYLSLSRISSLAWCLILIIFHMLLCCEDDLRFLCKKPPENNSKYHLSLDNWYFIMWYRYWSSLHWLLLVIALSLAQKNVFVLTPVVFRESCVSTWFCWTCFVLFPCR